MDQEAEPSENLIQNITCLKGGNRHTSRDTVAYWAALYSSSLLRQLVNSVPELPQACWINTDVRSLNVAQQRPLQDDVGGATIIRLSKNKHRHMKCFNYPKDAQTLYVNSNVNLHCGNSITVLFCYMQFI